MTSLATIVAALLDVRTYLAREAQSEDIRNEAAWEAGSTGVEHAASDALNRLDEILGQLKDCSLPGRTQKAVAPDCHPQMAA